MPLFRSAALPHLALALALAGGASGAEAGTVERVWLDVSQPGKAAAEVGLLGLLEVQGWAGAGSGQDMDVVLAIDVSASTMRPAGGDVDGDGRVGRELRSARDPLRSFNPRRWCTDPGDTIRAAELTAARRFVAAVDPARTRTGLVVFADAAELRGPLGSPPDALAVILDRLEESAGFGGFATDLAAAVRTGTSALTAANTEPGTSRKRWLVLLSDGAPAGAGSLQLATEDLRRAGEEAARAGVHVYAIALGALETGSSDAYRQLARSTGGRFAQLQEPADVTSRLASLDLSRVEEVRLENRTNGARGRAVRISPDGRFDGVVALAPGANRIRVTARGPGGTESMAERLVHFEPREARTLAEARLLSEKLERLKARTTLLELGAELERARLRARERLVELRAGQSLPDVAADR